MTRSHTTRTALTLTLAALLLVTSVPAQATPRRPGRATMTKQQVSHELRRNLLRVANRSWHCAIPHRDVTITARRILPGRPYGAIPGTAPTDRRVDTRLVSWRTTVNGLGFQGCCVSCTKPTGTTNISRFQILQKPAGLTIPAAQPRELKPENLTAAERRFFGAWLQ